MTKLPIFLINLDGSDARLDAAKTALQAESLPYTRHPAFDGRQRDLSTIPEYDAGAARAYMGRDLTGGEVGCFISHVQVATRFLETDAPFALVLEDDMKPLSGWLAMINALTTKEQQEKTTWDLAHLAANRLKIVTPLFDLEVAGHRARLHRAHYFPMRTTALLWSRKGAERFVRSAYPINCPVDLHMRRLMQQNDGGVAIDPPCFTTTEAASDIVDATQNKRGRDSRGPSYPVKRAARVLNDNLRAAALQRKAKRDY